MKGRAEQGHTGEAATEPGPPLAWDMPLGGMVHVSSPRGRGEVNPHKRVAFMHPFVVLWLDVAQLTSAFPEQSCLTGTQAVPRGLPGKPGV